MFLKNHFPSSDNPKTPEFKPCYFLIKRFPSEVVFSQAISNQGFGILGQKGFFDQFQITFNFQDLLIELEE